MNFVLGTHTLGLGGSETYLITLADQLQRLGHGVVLGAFVLEGGAQLARGSGVAELASLDGQLPSDCDGIVAQDGASAFELARRYPEAPVIFVAHSEEFDEQLPRYLEGVAGAVVVLNARVERRVRALAGALRTVRLAQPIDIKRFRPLSPPAIPPRRLLLLGNNGDAARAALLDSVAGELGLEVARVGAHGESTLRSELAIHDADIVMGYGRCILEAMACGRPAYVYDHLGGDGWVTPDTYPALERDGFGGRAFPEAIDRPRLLRDLRAYDPTIAIANRDLVVANHRAEHHAQALVELLRSVGGSRSAGSAPLGEMVRLVRSEWAAEARTSRLQAVNAELHRELHLARTDGAKAAAHWSALTRSRRYRIAAMLARPLDAARRLRFRGKGGTGDAGGDLT
jgi:hypothetical protein